MEEMQGASHTMSRAVPLCMAAMLLLSLSGVVLNATVYSRIATYYGIGREISTLVGGFTYLVFAYLAVKKPSVMDARHIAIFVIGILAVAAFLLYFGLDSRNSVAVMVGLVCRAVGNAWAITMFSVALCTIKSTRSVLVAVGVGILLSNLAGLVVPVDLPIAFAAAFVMGTPIAVIAMTVRMSDAGFQAIQKTATARSLGIGDLAEFKPLRMLPVCMLFVGIASGYALTFNEISNAPISTIANIVLVAGVVVFVMMGDPRKNEDEDKLFDIAALAIIAGFLVAPVSQGIGDTVVNALLRSGRDCFTVLIWLVLATLGRRNIFMLLPALGAVRFAHAVGTDIGAGMGRLTNSLMMTDPTMAHFIAAIIVFLFIAFLWLGFRDFSFTKIIAGVTPVTEPDMQQLGDSIEAHCRALGAQHDLTEREIEILVLLAKGRDGKFIADEFVLSYNTVKTHVKHIYQKLGIHSRQDLIDLVG